METHKPKINPERKEYRDALAEEIKAESDFLVRRELLQCAQATGEYEAAERWRKEWRAKYIENRALAKARVEQGLISADEGRESQHEITENFLKLLVAESTPDILEQFSSDPSPFVRYEVATRAKQLGNEALLAKFEGDDNPEVRHFARRALAEMEVNMLLPVVGREELAVRLSDIFSDVPIGEGTRFFVIEKGDKDTLRKKYDISEDDEKNLQFVHHFRQDEHIDMMWWGLVDIRHLPDGRKVWLLEEIQSDILQKTKNKKLKEEFFRPCGECGGKGVIQKTKKEQERCATCQGAAALPTYPERLLEDIQRLGKSTGTDMILMPTAESMLQKYIGLLKPTKAKLLYDAIPSRLGFKKQDIGNEIEFGQEDGGMARAREFWRLDISK